MRSLRIDAICEQASLKSKTWIDDGTSSLSLDVACPSARAGLERTSHEMIIFIVIVLLAAAIAIVYRVGRSLLAASRPSNRPVADAKSTPAAPAKANSVALVVLGDIGRSPRMLYHADSFARNGFETRIVAHRGALSIRPPFLLLGRVG